MNNLKDPLDSLKKLKEELYDELDKSKQVKLDSIIDAFERDCMTQSKKMKLFGEAIKLIPSIVNFFEMFR